MFRSRNANGPAITAATRRCWVVTARRWPIICHGSSLRLILTSILISRLRPMGCGTPQVPAAWQADAARHTRLLLWFGPLSAGRHIAPFRDWLFADEGGSPSERTRPRN